MSLLQENLQNLALDLVRHISGFEGDSQALKCLERATLRRLHGADTSFLAKRKEVDAVVRSLGDKFRFHGFPNQAGELQRNYDVLMGGNLSKDEAARRLAIVKLLASLSERPTSNFDWTRRPKVERYKEEEIDWPRYLQEGIARWTPPPDVDDSSGSDFDVCNEELIDAADSKMIVNLSPLRPIETQPVSVLTHRDSKLNLERNVQSYWFSREKYSYEPPSGDREANITLLWDSFVQDLTKGLIPMDGSVIVSEYKMVREILWQFYRPHQSACFHFIGNKLVAKSNVTISSVRHAACKSFLSEFVQYIDCLQELRDFGVLLSDDYPHTYRSYENGLQTILTPIFAHLQDVEDTVKLQESTFTLLTLANRLRPSFETAKLLLDIHRTVTPSVEGNSTVSCATALLSRLYKGLLFAASKLEQDIYLTLYLHSLYKYLTIINNWLESDVLNDYQNEFVIYDENRRTRTSFAAGEEKRKVQRGLHFSIRDLDDDVKSDPILRLICTQVLELGKNYHLLRLLHRRHAFTGSSEFHSDTFYEAFKRRVLEKIAVYFDGEIVEDKVEPIIEPDAPSFVFPVGCPDECKYPTEMDKLENLVDTGDGFLVKAFEAYFVQRPKEKKVVERSLFERIQSVTQGLFPAQNILPSAFMEILDERYGKLGVAVKNLLVDDYELQKHFLFLQNIFLFKEDMIFSFYNYFFNILDSNRSWSIQTSLTSHLQDTIADAYPKLYNKATVDLKENWQLTTDPVVIFQKINIHYQIEWPINIIVRDEHVQMYSYLFQFILKIKWALRTLNHMYFAELVFEKPPGPQPVSLRRLIRKLQILRFGLVNLFSNIQHYVLGHVFSKLSLKFKTAFENASGLENVTKAHADFVRTMHGMCRELQERERSGYGFCLLLHLVMKLKTMWGHVGKVGGGEVDLCEKTYWMCHSKLAPIINPTGFLL